MTTISSKRALGAVASSALLLSACMADDPHSNIRKDMIETSVVQPRNATYDCGSRGAIRVENMHAMVRLVEDDGELYELPASPPTQSSRYGEGGLALVIEEREALWMKAGSEPVTCRR